MVKIVICGLLVAIMAGPGVRASVESKVEAIERVYRHYSREHLAMIDSQTGEVFARARGNETDVYFSINTCRERDYPILTHNHPWGLYYTLSANDVQSAMMCDAEQVRAAGWDVITGRPTVCIIQRNEGSVSWPFELAGDMKKDFEVNEGLGVNPWDYQAVTDAWVKFWMRWTRARGYGFWCGDLG